MMSHRLFAAQVTSVLHPFETATYGGTRAVFEMNVDGKDVGGCEVIKLSDTAAQTESLEIMSSYRGKGYARLMYEELFKKLRAEGFTEVESSDLLKEGGEGVWESLKRDYPINFEGGRYHLKLAARSKKPKPETGTGATDSGPGIFYHGTTKTNAAKILKEGLTPQTEDRAALSAKGYVYLSRWSSTAAGWAKAQAAKRGDKPALIRIDLPANLASKVEADEWEIGVNTKIDCRFKGPIPASYCSEWPMQGELNGMTWNYASHKVTPFDRNEFKDPNGDDPNTGEGTNSYSVIPEEQAGRNEVIPIQKAFKDASIGKGDDELEAFYSQQYPEAGPVVDGRTVNDNVTNMSSISATFTDYVILDGIRQVDFSLFDMPPDVTKRTKALAEQIKHSGWIEALIVGEDGKGPFIVEGSHRYDALKILNAKAIPAIVVLDLEEIRKNKTAAGTGGIELSTEAFNNKGAWPIMDPKVTKNWDGNSEDDKYEDTSQPTDGFNIKRGSQWMSGGCYLFALALSERMPEAEFVEVGSHHVGLRQGNTYYDARGALTERQFQNGIGFITDLQFGNYPIKVLTKDQVMAKVRMPDEIEAARTAVNSIFGHVANRKRSKLGPHEHASTQINLPESAAKQVMEAATKIPAEQLAEDGRENQPHVTIKFPITDEDPEKLRQAIANQTPFTITLGKCLVFPTDTKGQKALVAEAHGGPLLKLHKAVDAAIGGDPDKYPYRPHVTIAYITVDYAQEYEGSDIAEGISFLAEGITLSYASGEQEMIPFGRAMAQTAKVGFLVVKRCIACETGGCVEHEGV